MPDAVVAIAAVLQPDTWAKSIDDTVDPGDFAPGLPTIREFATVIERRLRTAGWALTPLAPGVPLAGVIGCDGQHGADGVGCEDPTHCAATRTPEPPDSGPYEARAIEGSQGPMWEVIEHGAAEAECLAGEEGAKRIAAALNRAEPPDSGNGAALERTIAERDALADDEQSCHEDYERLEGAARRYRNAEWAGRIHEDESVLTPEHNARVEEWRAADAILADLLGETSPFRSGSPAPEGGAFVGQMSWPCECGHPKSDHYFGDAHGLHTPCQRHDACHDFRPAPEGGE